MSEPTRVAIVGLGGIGGSHAAALAELAETELAGTGEAVSVVAGSGGAADALADWPDAERLDVDEVLACGADVVVIASPSSLHAEQAIAALEAGSDVVVEKPLATTTADATAVLAAAARTGRRVFPVAQRRLESQHRALRALYDDGRLGTPVLIEASVPWWRDAGYYDASPWRRQAPAGGSLMNQGVHQFDLLSWFLGPVRSVTAQTATLGAAMRGAAMRAGDPDDPAEDTAVVTLAAESGALGVIATSTVTPPGASARLALRTTAGLVELSHGSIDTWQVPGVDRPEATEQIGAGSADPRAIGLAGHVALWRDVLGARAEGRPAVVEAVDGWRTAALIDAAYTAAATGRRVDLPQPPGADS